MVVASLVTGFVAMAVPARADSTIVLSESLFVEGKRLMAAGQYAEACPKLEESYRLDPATGTLLNLATCHEKAGKIATAWAEYREAIGACRKDGRPDRETFATEHAKALESVLSRLTIVAPDAAQVPGLEVRLDGKALGKGSWGTAIPLDPGEHHVSASAPGKKAWESKVELGASAGQQQVTVPPLSDDRPAQAGPAPNSRSTGDSSGAGTGLGNHAGSESTERTTSSATWRRPVGYATGGLGLVLLGVGTAFMVDRNSKLSDRDAICPLGLHCTSDESSRISHLTRQARTSGQVATVGFVSGGVALVGGILLVLTAPSKQVASPSAAISVRAWRDAHATWVSAGGAW
jgi:hypothetical protein